MDGTTTISTLTTDLPPIAVSVENVHVVSNNFNDDDDDDDHNSNNHDGNHGDDDDDDDGYFTKNTQEVIID
jgi:hypothetical protein